jgi:hypothetical protein
MTEPRAQAPDANERSEDKPGGSYIWALVIGSMIERWRNDYQHKLFLALVVALRLTRTRFVPIIRHKKGGYHE